MFELSPSKVEFVSVILGHNIPGPPVPASASTRGQEVHFPIHTLPSPKPYLFPADPTLGVALGAPVRAACSIYRLGQVGILHLPNQGQIWFSEVCFHRYYDVSYVALKSQNYKSLRNSEITVSSR